MSAKIHPVPQNYGIPRWGGGYYGINSKGHATVCPDRSGEREVDLSSLAHEVKELGLTWPVLLRFTDILHDRVSTLCGAFATASDEWEYRGDYTAIYPIKVNQQRSVVEEIIGSKSGNVGLEAGSKPELLVALSEVPVGGTVVCNGYKDREYVRLALIGQMLGLRVFIVIEKASELDLVLQESASLGVEPFLGVRIRLATFANGKWQSSGGEKAKFGLTANQLLGMVNRLKQEGRLHNLKLIHCHIGSQIPDLRDIRRGVSEAARYFGELWRLGAEPAVVDVGGGLGIDYEGTSSQHMCSANYGVDAYAREVVKAFANVADENGLPHPEIFTESGRALTAHHAMLMINVIDDEVIEFKSAAGDSDEAMSDPMEALLECRDRLDELTPAELYHDGMNAMEEVRDLFSMGRTTLDEVARAEALFNQICEQLMPRLRPGSRRHRELLDALRERMADRWFCNFSIFQSTPDSWAIDQVFPVMPIQRLKEEPERSAVLHDLTCDSDGTIHYYVDQDGIEHYLPIHRRQPNEEYLLGVYLVGAYQEILGDIHNLFGDTDAVNLILTEDGGYKLVQPEMGDTIEELLRYLHFSPGLMLERYKQKLQDIGLEQQQVETFYQELEEGLSGYTYFEE